MFGTFCVCGVIFYLCDCCTPKVVRPISLCLMVLRWSQPPHTPSHSGGKGLSVPPNPWKTKMREITVRFSVAMTLSSHFLQTLSTISMNLRKGGWKRRWKTWDPVGPMLKEERTKSILGSSDFREMSLSHPKN